MALIEEFIKDLYSVDEDFYYDPDDWKCNIKLRSIWEGDDKAYLSLALLYCEVLDQLGFDIDHFYEDLIDYIEMMKDGKFEAEVERIKRIILEDNDLPKITELQNILSEYRQIKKGDGPDVRTINFQILRRIYGERRSQGG